MGIAAAPVCNTAARDPRCLIQAMSCLIQAMISAAPQLPKDILVIRQLREGSHRLLPLAYMIARLEEPVIGSNRMTALAWVRGSGVTIIAVIVICIHRSIIADTRTFVGIVPTCHFIEIRLV